MKRKVPIITVAAILFVIAAILFYGIGDPESGKLYPKCPFFLLTGLECPGCGSQRAVHSILNGDIAGALHYNILVVIAIPYILIFFILKGMAALGRDTKTLAVTARINRFLYHGTAIYIILIIVISFWIIRNFTPAF